MAVVSVQRYARVGQQVDVRSRDLSGAMITHVVPTLKSYNAYQSTRYREIVVQKLNAGLSQRAIIFATNDMSHRYSTLMCSRYLHAKII